MIYIGQPFIILPVVDSTNNYAMAQVRAGLASSGQVWLAIEQTAGRGQRQKNWLAGPGSNITLSVALEPGLPLQKQFLVSAAAAVGTLEFFKELAGDETRIKWPNDLYWRDRKAGGILIENLVNTEAGQANNNWTWAVIGIGINVNQANFPPGVGNAVSLLQITGRQWDIIDLSKALCYAIQEQLVQLNNPDSLLLRYNEYLFKRGETVKFKKGNRLFNALVKEVNAAGELLVDTGLEEAFRTGEVEWILSGTM
jgi:BirA family transcriptional regulator, biotin operon repressor / biotin---[acetyl-CoA-carboxylase] ligase